MTLKQLAMLELALLFTVGFTVAYSAGLTAPAYCCLLAAAGLLIAFATDHS